MVWRLKGTVPMVNSCINSRAKFSSGNFPAYAVALQIMQTAPQSESKHTFNSITLNTMAIKQLTLKEDKRSMFTCTKPTHIAMAFYPP